MRIRITLVAKEKLISLSNAAFKSTGSIRPSGDIFHSTCSISALANSITGGIPGCSSERKPQKDVQLAERARGASGSIRNCHWWHFCSSGWDFSFCFSRLKCWIKPRRQTPTKSWSPIKLLITYVRAHSQLLIKQIPTSLFALQRSNPRLLRGTLKKLPDLPNVVPASGLLTDETMTKPKPSFSPRRISTS